MKRFLGTALIMILCFMAIIVGTPLVADAAVVVVETISEGEVWHNSWSAEVEFSTLRLEVEETGLYDITITDHIQTGAFDVVVTDVDTQEYIWSIYEEARSDISQKIFLQKDRTYELSCSCYAYDPNGDLQASDAEMSIVFYKNTEELAQLPNCPVSTSSLMAQFTDTDEHLWVKFKTSEEGDYSFNFTNLHAVVSVYDINKGEKVYSWCDTEYYDTNDYYDWVVRNALIFHLEENTEYYLYIDSYSAATSKLSMTKCDKTVREIVAGIPRYTFTSMWSGLGSIDRSCFYYDVIYTDGTTQMFGDYTLQEQGYILPQIEYVGETITINGESYLEAGQQPVESTYNGVTTTLYIEVESFTEVLSYMDPADEYDQRTIEYMSEFTDTQWWRIKVSNSGYYGIWRNNSDDFGTNFSYYSINILDKDNQFIPFDNDKRAWPLQAGEEYAMVFSYCYNSDCADNDITFWMQKVAELPGFESINGWIQENGKWYYYKDNVKQTGWLKSGNTYYYLNTDGSMATGWVKDSGKWYYMNTSGAMVTGWLQQGNTWYYLNSSGAMVTGKVTIGGKQHSFNSSGVWLGEVQQNGWVSESGKWYYYQGGVKVTGWQKISGVYYYFDGNGVMQTGWLKSGNTWYYLNSSGAMATGWAQVSGKWYYFAGSGAMLTGWQKINNVWYYFQSGGAMQTGWLNLNGTWYYFQSSGAMVTGSLKIGAKTYDFNSSGACLNP